MKNIMEMKQRAFAMVKDARTIGEKADAEKRERTSEERASQSKILDDIEKLESEITLEERQQKYDMAHASIVNAMDNQTDDPKKEKRSAFLKYVRQGRRAMTDQEQRALVEDSTGEILVPEYLDKEITAALAKITIMRGLATIFPTSSDRVRRRSMDDPVLNWGKLEKGAIPPDITLVPSEEYMYIEDLSGVAKIGRSELQDNDVNLENWLVTRFAKAKSEAEDTGFLIGTGHNYQQPDGVAVDSHITIVDLATADTIATDDILKIEYGVPAQYRKIKSECAFVMNSKTELALRLFRPAVNSGYYGNYMWQPSLLANAPNTFDGFAVYNQDDMNYPADSVALKNEVIFGNFKAGYRILDRGGMSIQRLDELYAEAGLVGFLAYFRAGGGILLPEAFRALRNPS